MEWLDRNLYAGAEVTEVFRELSKSISSQHLNFDDVSNLHVCMFVFVGEQVNVHTVFVCVCV